MMLGFLTLLLTAVVMVVLPALVGFLIGGDEVTAWATAVASAVAILGYGAVVGKPDKGAPPR